MTPKLVHGDVFDSLGELEPNSADAAVVDYPWEFDYQNGTDRMGYDHRNPEDNPMFDMADDKAFSNLLDIMAEIMSEGSWILCFADDRFQDVVRKSLQDKDEWTFRRNWAWSPQRMGMGYYGRVSHYPIPTATLGNTERYVQDRGTLYLVDGRADSDYPTAKPAPLYREMLSPPVLKDGDRLLEPFCGSAPGLAVCQERGIDYWGCDISEDALRMARERIEDPKEGVTDL